MKMRTSKSIALKYNIKKLLTNSIPSVAKIVNKRIKQIKSRAIKKILSDKKIGLGRKASNNRKIKSLENNLSVEATKNITNTPKRAIEKLPIVVKSNAVTSSKIPNKPKIVDKSSIVTSKISSKTKIATKKKN